MKLAGLPLLALPILTLLLSACGEPGKSAGGFDQATSRALSPANAELAAVYNRSCRSCHTVAATGAPLTGDVAAWDVRMQKGMDVLVDNVIKGFGRMPPLGMCMNCDAEQFEALTRFMAKGK